MQHIYTNMLPLLQMSRAEVNCGYEKKKSLEVSQLFVKYWFNQN